MIELLLAAHFYITDIPQACHDVHHIEAHGCYFPDTKDIFISSSVPKIHQYIIFYHEVGHLLYGFSEYTADQFSYYMMAQEQPIFYIFVKESFACDQVCTDVVQAFARFYLK